jgi:predicted alpha-1,6-mannanase (GH76 family)
MMHFYDPSSGFWKTTGRWNSANAMTALIDYSRLSGSTEFLSALSTTFEKNSGVLQGDFANDYLDDTGWWGLAWLRAYDLTGEHRYLDTARRDADHMYANWDQRCGGGIWWRVKKDYKNAITNELFITLAASLHQRIPGDTAYLTEAERDWAWFQHSGLINRGHLVNDGLDTRTCRNNRQTTWTYNQGVILGALQNLSMATGDPGLLDQARIIADAATHSRLLTPDGILTEPCEASGCGADGPSFKGIFMRFLGDLNAALPDRPYSGFIQRQEAKIWDSNRNDSDQFGLHWSGPFDTADAARQHSALDALNAALTDTLAPAIQSPSTTRQSSQALDPSH